MANRPNSQTIILLFLIIPLIISFLYSITPINNMKPLISNQDTRKIENTEFTFNQLTSINVTCFSETNNNSNHLEFVGNPSNPSVSAKVAMKLPSPPLYDQWYGWNTSLKIYNLRDNRTWGRGNYDFSNGVDTGTPAMSQTNEITEFHNDTLSDWMVQRVENSPSHNDMSIEWTDISHYVDLTYYGDYAGGYYYYDQGESLGITQLNFNVFRGRIFNAWIKLIYNPTHTLTSASAGTFAFSAEINGKQVFQRQNEQMSPGLVNTGWIPLAAWINTSNVFPSASPSGYTNFNFGLYLKYIKPGTMQSNFPNSDYQQIRIYGFYLAIESLAPPNTTNVKLIANDQLINGTFGSGNAKWLEAYPFSSANPHNILFRSSSSETYIDLAFDVDVYFKIIRFVGTTLTQNKEDLGVSYSIDTTKNIVKYKFYLYCYWDLATYSKFYYNFTIPRDWNITLVKNPSLRTIFNKATGYNLGVIGGIAPKGIISVPSKNSTGQTLGEMPGWWYFEAEARNYLSTLQILKKQGSSWVPATQFNSTGYYNGDLLRVKAIIRNATGTPPGLASSAAYLKILFANGTTYLTQSNNSINAVIGDVFFGPFTLAGKNTTSGIFKAEVFWNKTYNYYTGYNKLIKPGSYYSAAAYSWVNFTIIHDSALKIINPIDAQTDFDASLNYFDIFTLKVALNDTDSNRYVPGAAVRINWTSILTLTDLSGGLYSINLNTADLGAPGIYCIRIYSLKMGCTNTSIYLKLNIIAKSVLDTLISPSPAALGSNFKAKLFYHLPANPNYNYTNALINISKQPMSDYLTKNLDYSYVDLTKGVYNITIFTGSNKKINNTGEINLYIHASKTYVENATKQVLLYINTIPTNLLSNKSSYITGLFWNVTCFVNYTITSNSAPILGATLTISGQGTLPYAIREVGAGIYSVQFNATIAGVYDIIATANKINYEQKSINFILSIADSNSIIENLEPITPQTLTENISVKLAYYNPDSPLQRYSGALLQVSLGTASGFLIPNIDYIFTDNLNGTYTVLIFTGAGTHFNETGQYMAYIHASKLNVRNASRKIDIFLNPYSTSLTSNQTFFSRSIFENVTFFVNYTLETEMDPIVGAAISSSGHESLIYTFKEIGNGIYSVQFNVSSIVKTYNIILTASKINYEQKSISFALSVNLAESDIELLTPPIPKRLSENISAVLLYFNPYNPLQNYSMAVLSIRTGTPSGFLTETIDFISQNDLNGAYTVLIFTGDGTPFNETGQYSIYIQMSQIYVENASRKIDLFLESYQTLITTNQSLFSAGIYQNITMFVNYTLLNDYSPIPGATIVVSGAGALPYHITEIGNGIYCVEFNSSLNLITYDIILSAEKSNFEQKSVSFTLRVDEFDSILENLEPIIPQTLSENITIKLIYFNPSNPGQNYSKAILQLSLLLDTDYLLPNSDYICIDNLNGTYTLLLYTGMDTSFNETRQYSIYIHASRLYVKNATRKLDLFLNSYRTQLVTNQTLFACGVFENMTLFVNYTVAFNSSPIIGANITVSGQETLFYIIKELGNGLYSLKFNSSSAIKVYNIVATASKTNHEQKSVTFILTVDEFASTLESLQAIPPTTLAKNISVIMFYFNPSNSAQNYTGAAIQVSFAVASNFLVNNKDYFTQNNQNGTYSLLLLTGDSTLFNETGQYSIYIQASRLYVKNASRKIDIFIEAYKSILTTNQIIFTQGMFENITFYLNYTLKLDSSPILAASIAISGHGALVHHLKEAGNGLYIVIINTSDIKTSYDILIVLSKKNYEQKSQSFILNVADYNTMLTTNKSVFQVQSNQNITLYVNYTKEDGTPIENANLFVLGITLDYTKNDLGNGLYAVKINASNQFANYDIILIANKTNYKQKSLSFVLSVNVLDSSIEIIQGQSILNFRENLTLLIMYVSPNNPKLNFSGAYIEISSAIQSDYWIENLHYFVTDNLNGTYTLTLFTGETYKINRTEQNFIHIHASKPNIRNATRSYSFFINPIQTELIVNNTIFEIPKYELINFSIRYQTQIGQNPLDNASILIYGINEYSIRPLSQGFYEIIIPGGNITRSYAISIVTSKQNYEIASADIALIVTTLDEFTQIKINQTSSVIESGYPAEFTFTFYYEYTDEYLTSQNITARYEWAYGSGELSPRGSNEFILAISSQNIPVGEYQIKVSIYDQEDNKFAEQTLTLTITSKPVPPWLYIAIGAAVIAAIILILFTYYFKIHKPKRIFRNRALMEKYHKYLDATNIQNLILIDKKSGITVGAKAYKTEKGIDVDLISGFLQAISSFGKELAGVETAMEKISYKGSKILLENGNYVNACLLLKESETESLKHKIKQATEEFEKIYASQLQIFSGNVEAFRDAFIGFDKSFEIYLTHPFKMNYDAVTKVAKTFNANEKKILRIITSQVPKDFTLHEIFSILSVNKIKLADPVIFSELYDLIEKKVIISHT